MHMKNESECRAVAVPVPQPATTTENNRERRSTDRSNKKKMNGKTRRFSVQQTIRNTNVTQAHKQHA